MSDISEKFWDASVEELKKGYVFDEETEEYICLACGETFIKGVIYQDNQVLYEAEKFVLLIFLLTVPLTLKTLSLASFSLEV